MRSRFEFDWGGGGDASWGAAGFGWSCAVEGLRGGLGWTSANMHVLASMIA